MEWLVEAGHKFIYTFGREGIKFLAHRVGLPGKV